MNATVVQTECALNMESDTVMVRQPVKAGPTATTFLFKSFSPDIGLTAVRRQDTEFME